MGWDEGNEIGYHGFCFLIAYTSSASTFEIYIFDTSGLELQVWSRTCDRTLHQAYWINI
jgi:hypothetical protein